MLLHVYAVWQVDFSLCRAQATPILPQQPHPSPLPEAETHGGFRVHTSHCGKILRRRGGSGFSCITRNCTVQARTNDVGLEDLPIRTVVAQQHFSSEWVRQVQVSAVYPQWPGAPAGPARALSYVRSQGLRRKPHPQGPCVCGGNSSKVDKQRNSGAFPGRRFPWQTFLALA